MSKISGSDRDGRVGMAGKFKEHHVMTELLLVGWGAGARTPLPAFHNRTDKVRERRQLTKKKIGLDHGAKNVRRDRRLLSKKETEVLSGIRNVSENDRNRSPAQNEVLIFTGRKGEKVSRHKPGSRDISKDQESAYYGHKCSG